MARTTITLLFVALLVAAARGQYSLGGTPTAADPEPTVPAPVVPAPVEAAPAVPEPTPIVAEPVATPETVQPVVPETTDPAPAVPAAPAAIVSAAELQSAKDLLDSIYKQGEKELNGTCDPAKLVSEYYALSIVNCDRAQTDAQNSGQPLTACPTPCTTGVTHVGAACASAFNLVYIRNMSATSGPKFTAAEYDPLGTSNICGVELPADAKAEAFAVGHMTFLTKGLPGGKVTGCDNAKLTSSTFAAAKVKCDAATAANPESVTCSPECQAAVDAAGGKTCAQALIAAAQPGDAALFSATVQSLETCSKDAPIAPPQAAPSTVPSDTSNQQQQTTSGAVASSAAVAMAAAAMAFLL